MMTYGQYIKHKRLEKGYSQRKLGLLSEIANTTISRMEKDLTEKPDVDTLKALEKALELNENELVSIAYPLEEEDRELTNEEYEQFAKDIVKIFIKNGDIKEGEVLTDEKREKLLKLIDKVLEIDKL